MPCLSSGQLASARTNTAPDRLPLQEIDEPSDPRTGSLLDPQSRWHHPLSSAECLPPKHRPSAQPRSAPSAKPAQIGCCLCSRQKCVESVPQEVPVWRQGGRVLGNRGRRVRRSRSTTDKHFVDKIHSLLTQQSPRQS